MNKKKIKGYTLFTAIVIGSIITCLIYQCRLNDWQKHTRLAFARSLKEELQKRGDIDIKFYGTLQTVPPEERAPEKVAITTQEGRKEYVIPSYKYYNSIAKETHKRMLYSAILEARPLIADSLKINWDKFMADAGKQGNTYVRISVTDLKDNTTITPSPRKNFFSPADSLISYYIGYRCEIEVTGFANYTWWNMLGTFWLSALVFFYFTIFLIYVFFNNIEEILKRYLVKDKIIEKEILVPFPVIGHETKEIRIYQLEDNCFYDAELRLLKKNERTETLTLFPSILMEAFLNAEDYKLTIPEIDNILWNGKGNDSRIHKTIGRLRSSLTKVSNATIENINYAYQLKIPLSIDNPSLETLKPKADLN